VDSIAGEGRRGHTAHAGMSAKWPWAAVEVAKVRARR